MRFTLAALIVTFALPAHGADRQVWGFIASGQEARLFYGVPESDTVTITFACEAGRVAIVSTVLPKNPRKGQKARTTLSNGHVSASYDGTVGEVPDQGFHFEASTAAEPKVVEVLKSGRTLSIGVPGKQERVPLKGAARPLARFEAACFRGR